MNYKITNEGVQLDNLFLKYNTWYRIPDFNGYELSIGLAPYGAQIWDPEAKLYCAVRSTKNFIKYPYGYCIQYYHDFKNRRGYWFEMSDYNNKRKRLKLLEIFKLMNDRPLQVIDVPDYLINIGSRNRATLNPPRQNMNLGKEPATISFSNLISG